MELSWSAVCDPPDDGLTYLVTGFSSVRLQCNGNSHFIAIRVRSVIAWCGRHSQSHRYLYCSQSPSTVHFLNSMHIASASLSSSDLVFHGFFTPSSHLVRSLPLFLPLPTSGSNALFCQLLLTRFICPNQFKTLRSTIAHIFSHTTVQ